MTKRLGVHLCRAANYTVHAFAVANTAWDRVGGGVTSAVLPHHRTYGSVYGGSRSPLETEPLIPQRQEFTAIKVGFRKSSVHV